MATNTSAFEKALSTILDSKLDIPIRHYGVLGSYINGQKLVYVPNRPNFVYVRLNNSDTEIIQAYNNSVADAFDLAVIVEKRKEDNFFRVVELQLNSYGTSSNQNYIARHAKTHQLGYDIGTKGRDPIFIYKRQVLQPFGGLPISDDPMKVRIYGDFYRWNGFIRYFPNTDTIDLTVYKPTGATNARFVNVYINPLSDTLGYTLGDEFENNFYLTGIVTHIPETPYYQGIDAISVLLNTGTSKLEYDDIRDIRNFIDNASTSVALHPLDPIYGYHSGTLRSSIVTIGDIGNYYTGTVVEDALQEIGKNKHWHGLARWNATGGTSAFALPENALYIENLFINGQIYDTNNYVLSGSNTIHLFNTLPMSALVLGNYVKLSS